MNSTYLLSKTNDNLQMFFKNQNCSSTMDSGKIVYTGTIVFTEIEHWTIVFTALEICLHKHW